MEEFILQNKENILKPLAVGNLLEQENGNPKYKFFIPSYQRGYRWGNIEVTDLLDDFFEFITTSKSREDKYCLQPIVVKKLEDGRYEVLDGQQRLTTIFILLSRLKKSNNDIDLFQLEYETRPDSTTFLKDGLNGEINKKNPDYFYISTAYKTIDNWLIEAKKIKPNISTKLFDAIVESIEFIWYEIIKNTDAIDVFTRINIGKIPLTNAELVKAVFLSKNNLSIGFVNENKEVSYFERILSLKQNAIALRWDEMGKKLQDPKIWGFIYGGQKTYQTRIDYILDLASKKTAIEDNKYYSFQHFYNKVKKARLNTENLEPITTSFIEEEWGELKEIFDILLEWYNNKTYNHLIGYLISQNYKVVDLVDNFKKQNRKLFEQDLKETIKKSVGTEINNLSILRYNHKRDNEKIGKILLLHNIINSLNINDENIRFPFDKMKNKLWTLEHIFAQNSEELLEDDYKEWLEDHLVYFEAQKASPEELSKVLEIIKSINQLYNQKGTIDKQDFETCFNKVTIYINEKLSAIDNDEKTENDEENIDLDWLNDDDSLANLALLDGSVNSSIKNSLFDIKRKLILQKDKEGTFIPNETKKVFLKYYTPSPNHLAYWTFVDRKSYIENIKKSLKYLN